MRLRQPGTAPAHIRDRAQRSARQLAGDTGNNSEALDVVFLRSVHQQLHAEAYSEYRLLKFANDVKQLQLSQALHGISRRADARQDNAPGATNKIWIGRQAGAAPEAV
jgi:hypothetical protein